MKSCAAVARILAAGVLATLAGPGAAQQAYPNKPIRFIVPYPPGGSTDPMARMVGQKLAESWGQPVIVDNRPGGNTVIGGEALAKSPPDGYTILLMGSGFVATPLLVSTPYDTIKDFDAVATIAKSQYVLVLNPSVPANTLQEFIALAKSKPGQLNYGSAGVASGVHLAAELFNTVAGTKMQHIPYKGSGPVVSDLIGGQLQLSFQVPIAAIAHIKSGKLKAIAITGETRLATLPQVPTFVEVGLPRFDAKAWYGVLAPAGAPKAIINKLSTEMAIILVMPDIREYLARQGMEPLISTPEQFAVLIKADTAKYAKVVKDANIKLE